MIHLPYRHHSQINRSGVVYIAYLQKYNMAITIDVVLMNFLISLVVSTIVIYVVVKLLGEEEGIGTAIMAAFIGAVIYAGAYYFLGAGMTASVIGGIAWLIALGSLYNIGWLKSLLIAVVVWVVVNLLSFLPTVIGPL